MSDFLLYALESAVCLALFYAVYGLFLKNETYFLLNRFYLISGLLFSLIIPGFKVTSPLLRARASSDPVSLISTPSLPSRVLGWPDVLLALYAAGAVAFLARFVIHLIKLHSVFKRSGWKARRDCRVVSVDGEFTPFSFLNVVFLNEKAVSPDNQESILAHERVHIHQLHSLDVLLMELVITLQWFNPFVWPYKKSLQETHEYLADHGVIAQGFSAARYKLLVFEQHVGAPLFEFTNNFKQSQIKRRLTMMSKIKSGNAAKLKLLIVLPLASFLVLAFAEPKPARSFGPAAVPVVQETAGHGQEEEIKKEKAAQAEMELQKLKENEIVLREKLKAAVDQEVQKELEMKLEAVLHKQQEIRVMLGHGGGAAGLKEDAAGLKAEYKKLAESELKIREVLAKTDDPDKKAELQHELQQVLQKQEQIKTRLTAGHASTEPTLEDLKKKSAMLDQKAADIRAELEKTQDAQRKAELEGMLKQIAAKQDSLKAEAQKIKSAQEQKKN